MMQRKQEDIPLPLFPHRSVMTKTVLGVLYDGHDAEMTG